MPQRDISDLIKFKTNRTRYFDHVNSRTSNTLKVNVLAFSDYINIINGGIRYYNTDGNVYSCDTCLIEPQTISNAPGPISLPTGGMFRWATAFHAEIATLTEAVVDNNDDLILTGSYLPPYRIYDSNISASYFNVGLPYPTNYAIPIINYNENGRFIGGFGLSTTGIADASANWIAIDGRDNSKYLGGGYVFGKSSNYIFNNSNGSTVSNILVVPPGDPTNSSLVFKYGSDGNFKWAVSIIPSSGGSSFANAGGVVDSFGNVYVHGTYSGLSNTTLIYNSNMSSFVNNVLPTSSTARYLVKYNSNGMFQHACAIMATDGNGLSIDSSNNVYLTGWFNSGSSNTRLIYNSNMSSVVSNVLPTVSTEAAYVIKFNSEGIFQYACALDSPGRDYAYKTNVDNSGNLYFAGFSSGISGSNTIKIYSSNQSVVTSNVLINPGTSSFLVKFDANGIFKKASSITASDVRIFSTTLLEDGYILSGRYTGTSNNTLYYSSNINTPLSNILPTTRSAGSFALRCDFDGNLKYALAIDGSTNESQSDVVVSRKYLYMIGQYGATNSNNIYIYGSNMSTITSNVLPTTVTTQPYVVQFQL